ncbi:FxSxx-COOH cyclophane-containing RiPP peptide [Streptomyces sp. WAC07094]|jgi:FXSXX-COOH protein|uniref:FxSxx-COOH cyclophane-containing RiPP peptide n=1 Tax=Streptomyces sp. WAC07094 TaxID=3072183 RepID=UPI002EAC1004|nr:FxSxx-COOH cyclophane-containing RiPP peptide [Streptomyces sp. WAC07094]
MEARDEAAAEVAEAGEPTAQASKPLPDLLELDLDELRTLRHPVLTEVLDELRERAAQPSEMLWGFNSAF